MPPETTAPSTTKPSTPSLAQGELELDTSARGFIARTGLSGRLAIRFIDPQAARNSAEFRRVGCVMARDRVERFVRLPRHHGVGGAARAAGIGLTAFSAKRRPSKGGVVRPRLFRCPNIRRRAERCARPAQAHHGAAQPQSPESKRRPSLRTLRRRRARVRHPRPPPPSCPRPLARDPVGPALRLLELVSGTVPPSASHACTADDSAACVRRAPGRQGCLGR